MFQGLEPDTFAGAGGGACNTRVCAYPPLCTSGRSCLWEGELENGWPEVGERFIFQMYILLDYENFASND